MAEHRWDTTSSSASADPGDPGVSVPGRRRWLLSFRAAVLAVCLLLGTAAAFAVLRGGGPVEVSSVELDAAGSSPDTKGAGAETPGGANPDPEQPAYTHPGNAAHPGTAERSDSEQPASAPTVLVVHVAGAVLQPGVVRVPEGSRTVDAVDAAGGAASDADLTAVNLAAALQDGSMVVVPRMGDPPRALPGGNALPDAGTGGGSGGGTGAGPGSGSDGPAGLVNLNTASVQELDTLPRIGPVIAERIVAWREEHGAFSRPEDLDAVPGIGEGMLASLLPLVTV